MPPRRKGKTTLRHYRADDSLYAPALARAQSEGHSLSEVIRGFLRRYISGELRHEESPPPEETGSQ